MSRTISILNWFIINERKDHEHVKLVIKNMDEVEQFYKKFCWKTIDMRVSRTQTMWKVIIKDYYNKENRKSRFLMKPTFNKEKALAT